MELYILDTNLFFNMEGHMGLGDTTENIIKTLTKAMQQAKEEKEAQFYVTPGIVMEIKSFFENPDQDFLQSFFASLIIKSPSLSELSLSATIMAGLIEETRQRNYRGMKVGEEEITNAGQLFMGRETLGKKEFQMAVGQVVTKYRDRFRNATRTGFIDSVADFELIMLAKELDGYLVSTDEGVIVWGRKCGVKEIQASIFGKKIQAYV